MAPPRPTVTPNLMVPYKPAKTATGRPVRGVLLRAGVLALLHRQIWRESPDGSPLLLALPWQYFAACIRTSSNSSPRTRSSKTRSWSSLSSDGTYRGPVGPSMMPRIRPIRRTYVQARSPAAAEEGAGVTAGFGAAVRGGSAVTTTATPKIASPPPMSTTPVTGSDKITAPNNTATAGLT